MNKLLKFSLFLAILAVFATVLVSCKDDEGEPDPQPEPTEEAPTITSVDPAAGLIGAAVTINGTNLNTVTAVTFGSTAATIGSQTATSISTTVPEGLEAGEVQIKVVNPDGEATANFTVEEEPCEFADDPICYCAENPEAEECTPLNFNGDFESEETVQGVVGGEGTGSNGGTWFFSSNGTGAQYEIVAASSVPGGSGENSLKVEVLALQDNPGADTWRIQVVNNRPNDEFGGDGLDVPAGKRFILKARVRADQSGRMVRVVGGISVPNYGDMWGYRDITLQGTWNDVAIYLQHGYDPENAGQPADADGAKAQVHARGQLNFNFEENEGAVFHIDDMQLIQVGDWVDPCEDEELFLQLYPNNEDVLELCVE